jgi:hypothetical protein
MIFECVGAKRRRYYEFKLRRRVVASLGASIVRRTRELGRAVQSQDLSMLNRQRPEVA